MNKQTSAPTGEAFGLRFDGGMDPLSIAQAQVDGDRVHGAIEALWIGDVTRDSLALTSAPGSGNRVFFTGFEGNTEGVAPGAYSIPFDEVIYAHARSKGLIFDLPAVDYDPANGPIDFGGPRI